MIQKANGEKQTSSATEEIDDGLHDSSTLFLSSIELFTFIAKLSPVAASIQLSLLYTYLYPAR